MSAFASGTLLRLTLEPEPECPYCVPHLCPEHQPLAPRLSVLSLEQFHALPAHRVTPNHVVLGVQSWPVPVQGVGRCIVTAVLLSGAVGDYVVYVGSGSVDWVADHGEKMPLSFALLAFPSLQPTRYRP